MRTSKTLSVSMSPDQLNEIEALARQEKRTMSELVREALRQYTRNRGIEDQEIDVQLLAVLRAVQQEAERKGVSKMSLREINAEIAAHRNQQRRKKPDKKPAA